MTCRSRVCVLIFVCASCLAAACGSSNGSLSPTGPSRAGGSPGAVINGRVTGLSAPATAPTEFSTRAMTDVKVTVVGTNISTSVNGTGQFTLTGVPPGDVRLNFSGSGVNATITLSGVSATDRITITVSLNGNSGRIESENRDDDDDDDNEVEGVVSNLSGTCPGLTFTVQRITVKTNSSTKFEGSCARVANGLRVEVEGRRQADETILATEVEIDD